MQKISKSLNKFHLKQLSPTSHLQHVGITRIELIIKFIVVGKSQWLRHDTVEMEGSGWDHFPSVNRQSRGTRESATCCFLRL